MIEIYSILLIVKCSVQIKLVCNKRVRFTLKSNLILTISVVDIVENYVEHDDIKTKI